MKWVARVLAVVVVAVVAYLALQERGRSDLNNEGVRLLNEGRYEEAVETFERALASEPNNETVRRNLAKAKEALGKGRGNPDGEDGVPDGGDDSEEALRKRAAERVARMKAEGWKKEEGVTLQDILKLVETMEDMGNLGQAKVLLERALFLEPSNLDFERRIERIEAQLKQQSP